MATFSQLEDLIRKLRVNDCTTREIFLSLENFNLSDNTFHNEDPDDDIVVSSTFHYYVGILSEVIYRNTVVEDVSVDYDFIKHLTDESILRLFGAIGNLSNLRYFYIGYDDSNEAVDNGQEPFSILFLVEALNASTRLQLAELDLRRLGLIGSFEDFNCFFDKLQKCTALTDLSFEYVSLPAGVNHDPLIKALSSIQSLETIQFNLISSFSTNIISIDSIEALMQLPSLEFLDMSRTLVDTDNPENSDGGALGVGEVGVANNMPDNELLQLRVEDVEETKSIVLEDDIVLQRCDSDVHNSDSSYSSYSSLKRNCTLRHLILDNNDLGDSACARIADLIRTKKESALEVLSLRRCSLSDRSCRTLSDALKVNEILHELRLEGNDRITKKGYQALTDALEENSVLKHLWLASPISIPSENYLEKIRFFLGLNTSGRRHELLGRGDDDVTREQYVENLINIYKSLVCNNQTNNIDHKNLNFSKLYYWIRVKPSLLFEGECHSQADHPEEPSRKRLKLM